MRQTALLLAFILLLAPAASATPSFQMPWQAALEEQQGPVFGDGSVYLTPLGDVDGDGGGELLVEEYGEQATVRVIGGAGLDEELWNLTLAGGWIYGSRPDMDGDGMADILVVAGMHWDVDSTGHSTNGIYLSAFESESSRTLMALDPRDGSTVWSVEDGGVGRGVGISAFQPTPVGFAYAAVDGKDRSSTSHLPFGQDAIWRVEESGQPAYAVGYVSAVGNRGGESVWTRGIESLTLSRLDNAGDVHAEVALDDRTHRLIGIGFADLDGDGLEDLLAREAPAQAPLPEGPAGFGTFRLRAFSAADGAVLWSKESSPELDESRYAWYEVIRLGDVDGDGADDVGFVDIRFVAEYTVHGTTGVLSGASGDPLVEAPVQQDGGSVPFPFGDLDGDGSREFLWVTFVEGEDQPYTIAARDAAGVLWEMQAPPFSYPLGIEGLEDASGDGNAFPDWTGDGAPDLPLISFDGEPYGDPIPARMELTDGVTGQTVWTRDLGVIQQVLGTVDATGDGMPDVVSLSARDADGEPVAMGDRTNGTIRIDVVRGTDGKHAWGRVVPVASVNGTNSFRTDLLAAGDIDGDGHDDFFVHMESRCYSSFHPVMVHEGEEEQPAVPVPPPECEEQEQYILLSGRDGTAIWTLEPLGETVGATPEAALPPVELGEAFHAAGEAPKEPAPAGAVLLAVLALAVALVLRRR